MLENRRANNRTEAITRRQGMYVRYLRQKYRSGGWLVSHHFLRYWPEQISAARWNPNIVVRSIIGYLYKPGTYKESMLLEESGSERYIKLNGTCLHLSVPRFRRST
jgi:hypothetical protein